MSEEELATGCVLVLVVIWLVVNGLAWLAGVLA